MKNSMEPHFINMNLSEFGLTTFIWLIFFIEFSRICSHVCTEKKKKIIFKMSSTIYSASPCVAVLLLLISDDWQESWAAACYFRTTYQDSTGERQTFLPFKQQILYSRRLYQMYFSIERSMQKYIFQFHVFPWECLFF